MKTKLLPPLALLFCFVSLLPGNSTASALSTTTQYLANNNSKKVFKVVQKKNAIHYSCYSPGKKVKKHRKSYASCYRFK